MSAESVGRFIEDIDSRILYFRTEYEMSYAEAIGSLDLIKHALMTEVFEDLEDEPEDCDE